jgi:hypothetical protein
MVRVRTQIQRKIEMRCIEVVRVGKRNDEPLEWLMAGFRNRRTIDDPINCFCRSRFYAGYLFGDLSLEDAKSWGFSFDGPRNFSWCR